MARWRCGAPKRRCSARVSDASCSRFLRHAGRDGVGWHDPPASAPPPADARRRSELTKRLTRFAQNERWHYIVRVCGSNPGLASLMLEPFGGPRGELAAACRYLTQALEEDDPARMDMLLDIATEELRHREVSGTIVAILNNGATGKLAEGVEQGADTCRAITGAGSDSHVTQVLYGSGPPPLNSAGVTWTAALH